MSEFDLINVVPDDPGSLQERPPQAPQPVDSNDEFNLFNVTGTAEIPGGDLAPIPVPTEQDIPSPEPGDQSVVERFVRGAVRTLEPVVPTSLLPEEPIPQLGKEPFQARRKAAIEEGLRITIANVMREQGFDIGVNDLPTFKVDTQQGAPLGTSIDAAFSENFDEQLGAFRKEFPDGLLMIIPIRPVQSDVTDFTGRPQEQGVLVFKEDANDPDEPFKTFAGISDIGKLKSKVAGLAGAAPEIGATILAAPFTEGASLLKTALIFGAASGIGSIVEEIAIDPMIGVPQYESIFGVGTRAAKDAALVSLFTFGLGLGQRVIKGEGLIQMSPRMQKIKKSAQDAIDVLIAQNPELKKGKALRVLLTQDLADHPLTQGMSAQALSTVNRFQAVANEMREFPLKALQSIRGNINVNLKAAASRIRISAAHWYNNEYNQILKSPFLRDAGKLAREPEAQAAFNQGVRTYLKQSQAVVRNAYQSVDDIAARQPLSFNFDAAQAQVNTIKQSGVFGIGKQGQAVEVSDPLTRELTGILDDITLLQGKQPTYEVAKQIRTRLGNLIFGSEFTGVQRAQLTELYKQLTTIMSNPVGISGARLASYQNSLTRANAIAQTRFDSLNIREIKTVAAGGNVEEVINLLSRPDARVSLRNLIQNQTALGKVFPEKQLDTVRSALRLRMVTRKPGTALESLDELRRLDPDLYKFIAGKHANELRNTAKEIDRLAASPLSQAEGAHVDRSLLMNVVRGKNINPDQMNRWLNGMMKNPKDVETLRWAIYEDMINFSRKVSPEAQAALTDDFLLSEGKLTQYIDTLKNTPIWNRALTDLDRKTILGLKDYLKLLGPFKGDVGVSLQRQEAVAQVKSLVNPFHALSAPLKTIQGINTLASNRIFAWAMLSPKVQRILTGSQIRSDLRPIMLTGAIASAANDAASIDDDETRQSMARLLTQLQEQGIVEPGDTAEAFSRIREE